MWTTQAEKARSYAQQHPQAVRLSWITHKVTTHSPNAAVELCADPLVAGNIIGALAADKTMEELLNQLIDAE